MVLNTHLSTRQALLIFHLISLKFLGLFRQCHYPAAPLFPYGVPGYWSIYPLQYPRSTAPSFGAAFALFLL